jgi:uncharacterized membrane protein
MQVADDAAKNSLAQSGILVGQDIGLHVTEMLFLAYV